MLYRARMDAMMPAARRAGEPGRALVRYSARGRSWCRLVAVNAWAPFLLDSR